ncbi:MAG TPA: glycosyltransferase family 1 protein [Anaeromyxobacteraceae bacterium]|jgi:glycosyltransferase involved in cell wall biosynthesis|nr:glycosyltransferase family 1 protein [Anaeromyxobacteraceae bacterium]
MKLAVSLLHLRPGQVGGAETYVRELLAALPAAAAPDEVWAVMDRDLAAVLDTPGARRLTVEAPARRVVVERILEAVTPYRALGLERALDRLAPDAVLFPQQSIFPRRVRAPAVLTVHDVQHLYHPENIPLAERVFRAGAYGRSLARADRIIAISEFTRTTLVERGCPAAKVTVIQSGFAPGPRTAPATPVGGAYLYFPAATFAHKNHALLFHTYAVLKRLGAVHAKLVLTGLRTKRWPALQRLARHLGIAEDVVHLGFVPYAEVRRLYAGAEAVLLPSGYEGFGLPAVEAAALGCKVITSRLPAFEEVGVPEEDRIDFAEPWQLRQALERPGPTVLRKQPSSWAEVARRTVTVLREAALSYPAGA